MEVHEIFENYIKIEPKVMSIESLFNNEDRVSKTNYKPFYQRNYVWDDEKATYFIESILLGTEIPPLIYFRNSDGVEVIDGRQRYETILRFKENDFKLKKNGLQKLENIGIANKYFKSIDEKLKELFWNTKLRIIEFSFHSKSLINDEMEEIVKKEIFKRYNSGITPLKPTDIDKAAYIEDDLNSYFKKKLTSDNVLYGEVSGLLYFEKSNIEIILKKIRQLLVLHNIPIKYFSIQKDSVIAKYFDFLFSSLEEPEIEIIFDGFITKINLLKKLRTILTKLGITYNRLIFECIYWAFSVLEVENGNIIGIDDSTLNKLATYIGNNKDAYTMERSSFTKELHNRYLVTSEFFKNNFNIDFTAYLQNNPEFKAKNQEIEPKNKEMTGFEELRINKPEPSSIAIDDICRQMEKQRFLIRPPYQRNEVINKKKSSAIIESILMGIKLPPIFVFKRKDDISEVLDGQQRLLSILGFYKKPYLDENNVKRNSEKYGFSLNLKNGILKKLDGKTFDQLSKEEKEKIKNFDLWIIEINEKNNEHFDPIDLFIRLNNKPYPIKEDTFEMWNSYISRDIIDSIKAVHKNNKDWFYLRKNNSRMEDENIYTSLIYLQYQKLKSGNAENTVSKHLDIYKIGDKINFRLKSKIEITKVLESVDVKDDFVLACFNFELNFLLKLKILLSDEESNSNSISKNLDNIFNKENNRRTQQSFYALWYYLNEIDLSEVESNKEAIRAKLYSLFKLMDNVRSKAEFDKKVDEFKSSVSKSEDYSDDLFTQINRIAPLELSKIAELHSGLNANSLLKFNKSTSLYAFDFIKEFDIVNFKIIPLTTLVVSLDDKGPEARAFFDNPNKIVVKKSISSENRLHTGLYQEKGVFNNNNIVITINRYGYNPKFILSLISSRLISYWVKFNSSALNNLSQITSHTIQRLPIPLVGIKDQAIFVKVFDYINHSSDGTIYIGFFQRLIDAMVYELYFKSEFENLGIEFINSINSLPEITKADNRQHIIESVYKELSDPNHKISSSMFRLLNTKEVIEIEGAV